MCETWALILREEGAESRVLGRILGSKKNK
jgi:hypothetical protein